MHTMGHHLSRGCWLYRDPGGTTYHGDVGCIETQGAPPTTGMLVVSRPRRHHLPRGCWLYRDPGGTTYHGDVGCIETQGAPPTTGMLVVSRPRGHHLPRGCWLYRDHSPGTIYNSGEWCLLLPRSSTGTLLLDLHPEAEYAFVTFRSSRYI